jgi:hypothetical protein
MQPTHLTGHSTYLSRSFVLIYYFAKLVVYKLGQLYYSINIANKQNKLSNILSEIETLSLTKLRKRVILVLQLKITYVPLGNSPVNYYITK